MSVLFVWIDLFRKDALIAFNINAVLLNFLFIKESLKKYITNFTEILSCSTVLNIGFLSILELCNTEDWSNDAENSVLSSQE